MVKVVKIFGQQIERITLKAFNPETCLADHAKTGDVLQVSRLADLAIVMIAYADDTTATTYVGKFSDWTGPTLDEGMSQMSSPWDEPSEEPLD
ncbi:hypothetical protein [Aquabacterium sp. CECT 9606]|uniref:hypothetical protein n=1 Tax=Aquabacterium sp. CECT 9606 TaxID=2845822 RepID=UPI001E63D26A|nr:hypothetical protein [Aquabacterium sp. CECT 9606]CAH0347834.1 hypothetical protein AQB9606_00053 [Aquabacterium sp. CECT 9606]